MFSSIKPDAQVMVTGKFFEKLYHHKLIQEDSLKKVVTIPNLDTEVVKQKREKRVAKEEIPDVDDPALAEGIKLFKKEWRVIKHHQRDFGLGIAHQPKEPEPVGRLTYQGVAKATDPKPVRIIDDLFDESSDFKVTNAKLRREGRIRLFDVLDLSGADLQLSDKRVLGPEPLQMRTERLILVECKSLKFELGDIEPMFCEMALFDRKNKVKISESFFFDMNSTKTASMLRKKGSASPLTEGTVALFRVPRPSSDIVLMFRLEKIARPKSNEQSAEAYFKGSSMKPKPLKAMEAEIKASCARFSYTQPFCWQVCQIFSPGGAAAGKIVLKSLQRIRDKDITQNTWDRMSSFFNEKELKKAKVIPGSAILEVSDVTSVQKSGVFTPDLVPAIPESKDNYVIREMRLLRGEDDTYAAPMLQYVNELFVYPQNLNLSKYSGTARNITIGVKLMDGDSDPTGPGLKAIYGRSRSPVLTDEVFTTISCYHNKKPTFYDEIKVKLPANLTRKHHLVFTFYHVTCAAPKKKHAALPPEAVVGHAFLPLLEKIKQDSNIDGILKNGLHSRAVGIEVPPNYMADETEYKTVGNKPAFNVIIKSVSSLYPQDRTLVKFLATYKQKDQECNIHALHDIEDASLARHYVRVLDGLLHIICNAVDGGEEALVALVKIAERVSSLPKEGKPQQHPFLVTYVNYILGRVDGVMTLHQQLAHLWINVMADPSGLDEVKDSFCNFSWFLFSVIIKSMTLFCYYDRTLDDDKTRPNRFTVEMKDKVRTLLTYLLDRVQMYVLNDESNLARRLNTYIGYFLKDLLTIEDRGFVFDLIFAYVDKIVRPGVENKALLIQLKFRLLKIVNDYEHYVPLNLPLLDQIKDPSELVQRLWQKHFLVGLFIREVFSCLKEKHRDLRKPGVDALRDLLLKHERDPRYKKSKYRARVMSLYFPYVLMLVSKGANIFTHIDMSDAEKRTILICFLYILKNMDTSMLWEWWKVDTVTTLKKFSNQLKECLVLFAYDPRVRKMKREEERLKLEEEARISQQQQAGKGRHGFRKGKGKSSGAKDDTSSVSSIPTLDKGMTKHEKELEKREAQLCKEAGNVVMDMLTEFIIIHERDLNERTSNHLDSVFVVILRLFKGCNSNEFLESLFPTMRMLIHLLSKALFHRTASLNVALCGDLTYEILRHCNYDSERVRELAATCLYSMMKLNYKIKGNKQFSRMKLQTTIATEKMVESASDKEDTHLRRCLQAIAAKEATSAQFGKELNDLMERLLTALANHRRINQYRHDPEMTAELFFQTSLGYNDSPDLRITWLANLSKLHEKNGNKEEAATCKINIAALVCAYLRKLKPSEAIPISHTVFRNAAPNIAAKYKIPKIDAEGVCTSSMFTRAGLFSELQDAVEMLRSDNLFESAIEVYKIVNGVHQKNKQWEQLGSCYGDMHGLCSQIIMANEGKSRLFATFYRVKFFGKRLENDGQEYIYKEQPFVRVADITNRIKTQLEQKYGAGKVEVLSNKKVDSNELDSKKVYFQLAQTEPFLTDQDRSKRKTEFERSFNIKSFWFDTPFVKKGGKKGNMKDQYVRKTILRVNRPFPDVLKRHKVVDREEIVLTPIETSIGVIEGRLQAMNDELNSKVPNTKTLQIILQGSVLLQVNRGSLEICEIFLEHPEEHDPGHVEKLQRLMKHFVKACKAGLKLNGTLIGAEQLEFQAKLTEGYIDMRQQVLKIVDPSVLEKEGEVEPDVRDMQVSLTELDLVQHL